MHRIFILDYSYHEWLPAVKSQITDMALNGSGVRDTARVLGISKNAVLSELKTQEGFIEPVNRALLSHVNPTEVTMV